MAIRIRKQHDNRTREKIQTAYLINRLTDCAKGTVELSNSQVKSIEILLRKSLPDLATVTLVGDADKPVEFRVSWGTPPTS